MIAPLLLYLLLAQLSDLASAAILAATDWTGVTLIQNGRDLLALALFAAGFMRADLPPALRWPVTAYLGVIGLYVLTGLAGEAGTGLVIRSAAKLALPPMLVLAGFACLRGHAALGRFTALLIGLAAASTLFGLWEVGHTEFWTDRVEYGDYLIAAKDVLSGFKSDVPLPFNFFGYDEASGTSDLRRAAGLVAAPLAQGSFLAFAAVFGFAALRRRMLWAAALLAFLSYGVYASGTRGALLMLLAALPLYLLLTAARLKRFGRDAALLMLGLAVGSQALAPIYDYTVEMEDGSTIGHVWALEDNLDNAGGVLLLGDGLGRTGTLAASAGLDVTNGLEGALFSALYQTGGPGALAFLWFYGAVAMLLYRRRAARHGELASALLAFAVGAASSLIISDLLMTVSGMAPFWLAAGGAIATLPEPARIEKAEEAPDPSLRTA